MAKLIMLLLLSAVGIAAQRWAFDSRDAMQLELPR
jgi:hypothetical protein